MIVRVPIPDQTGYYPAATITGRYLVRCDEPGCTTSLAVEASWAQEAKAAALAEGWSIRRGITTSDEARQWCPQHREAA